MTSFQDPQPNSRRAARQSERSGTAEAEVGVFPPSATSDDMWDTTSRRAAQLAPATHVPPVVPAAPTSGRRSAAADQGASPQAPAPQAVPVSGEPLDYVTQQRPVQPQSPAPQVRPVQQEAGQFRRPRAADAELPPTQAMPAVDQPRYRNRDYSPPVAPAPPQAVQPSPEWTEPYTPDRSLELDYQTQSRIAPAPVAEVPPTLVNPIIPAAQAPVAAVPPAVPVPEAPVAEAPVPEHTLTRREMRALQLKGQAPDSEQPMPLQEPASSDTTVSPGTPTGILSSLGFLDQTSAVPVVPDAAPTVAAPAPVAPTPEPTYAEAPAAAPVATETPDASVESAWPFALVQPTAQDAVAPAPTEAPVQQQARAESPLPPVAPEPIANTGLTAALAEFDQLTGTPAPEPVAPATPQPVQDLGPESAPWTPPRGHWSTQLDQEDEFVETTVNRTVGSGATATSSLLLPSIPEPTISGPLSGSGEILLTGSIDLPQNFSSTGASARLEHVGIDKLFESHDAEIVSTESSPVSAVNAISTRSGSGLGAAPKQQGTKALTALVIAAASMGVVVIGLLITALALNVFG